MTRPYRPYRPYRLAAGVLAILLAALTATLAPVPAGAAVQIADTVATALSSCIQSTHQLDVVFLVDESGSLGGQGRPGTDPNARRVDGVKAALSGLAALQQPAASGPPTSVHVLLAGFAGTTQTVPPANSTADLPFFSVNPKSLPAAFRRADNFAGQDRGQNTDFAAALEKARGYLAAAAAQDSKAGGTIPCRAIVLFTDGQLDLGSASATATARDQLCKPDGIADSITRDGVLLFSVALNSGGANPQGVALLKAFTDGSAGGCSTLASPSTGRFLSVNDASELSLIFGGLFTAGQGSGLLHSDPGTWQVPAWVNRFDLNIAVAQANAKGVLKAPDGSTVSFTVGADSVSPLPGVAVHVVPLSPVATRMSIVLQAKTGRGNWTLEFPGAAHVGYEVRLYGDYRAVPRDTTVTPGTTTSLNLAIEPVPGSSADPDAIPSGTTVVGSVATSSGKVPVNAGALGRARLPATFSVGPDDQSSSYAVQTQVKLPSAGSLPVSTPDTFTELARALPDVPTVTQNSLNLRSITGVDPGSVQFTVRGASGSNGCVWFVLSELSGPSAAGTFSTDLHPSATAAPQCLQIPAGQQRNVVLTLTPGGQANGSITGKLVTHSFSQSHPAEVVVSHQLSGYMQVPPNPVRRAGIFALLLAGLVLLPLLVIHSVNALTARLTSPSILRSQTYPLRIEGGRVLDADTGAPFVPPPPMKIRSLDPNVPSPFRGNFEVDGVQFSPSASGLAYYRFRPFTGPHGVATSVDGTPIVVYQGRRRLSRIRENRWRTSLDLDQVWVFRVTGEAQSPVLVSTSASVFEEPAPAAQPDGVGAVPLEGRLTVFVLDGSGVTAEQDLAFLATEILSEVKLPAPRKPLAVEEQAPARRSLFPRKLFGARSKHGTPSDQQLGSDNPPPFIEDEL